MITNNQCSLVDFSLETHSFPETQAKNLPLEILSLICSNFESRKDLKKVIGVCKNWDLIANDQSYAQLFFKFITPDEFENFNVTLYKKQLLINPKFLKEILPHHEIGFFNLVLCHAVAQRKDYLKLVNDPNLMLTAIKHVQKNPEKYDSGNRPLWCRIGGELRKDQNFLNEAVKYDSIFIIYLDDQNVQRVENDYSLIKHINLEFIANHREKFYPILKKNPEVLKHFEVLNYFSDHNDFQINLKNIMAKFEKEISELNL